MMRHVTALDFYQRRMVPIRHRRVHDGDGLLLGLLVGWAVIATNRSLARLGPLSEWCVIQELRRQIAARVYSSGSFSWSSLASL